MGPENFPSANRERSEGNPLHEYRKWEVQGGLERIRDEIDDRRDEILGYAGHWEALAKNDLTLPRHREEYLKRAAEARNLVDRLDLKAEALERTPEIREVETPEATFRLVYERHDRPHSPNVLEGLDAYAFEQLCFNVPKKTSFYVADSPTSGPFHEVNSSSPDAPVIGLLRESGLPTYSCDISGWSLYQMTDKEFFATDAAQNIGSAAFTVLGAYLLKESAGAIMGESASEAEDAGGRTANGMSRRRFLGIAGKTLAGTMLFAAGGAILGEQYLPGHETLVDGSVYGRFIRAKERLFTALGMTEVVMRLRNAVMAQQLHRVAERISEMDPSDAKPHIGMELGAKHFGIEDCLRMSESERVDLIRRIALTSKLVIESPDRELASFFQYEYQKPAEAWRVERFIDTAISDAFSDYPYRNGSLDETSAESAPTPK